MQWNSWQDFWHMGGYALYVWGSFGLTVAVVAGEILLARNRRQRILQELRDTIESEESKI
ncbi:MAG: heme exporter protein CcmD [Rhodoferax sp.]|nr:MAG: heme exporter protein CcmD [Rhodoferax sp.]